jgi:hypothetical protein
MTPKILSREDGDELVSLLNELSEHAWPLSSISDHVYLHFHADGVWQLRVGRMMEHVNGWFEDAKQYPTLVAALRAAVAVYRAYPCGPNSRCPKCTTSRRARSVGHCGRPRDRPSLRRL